MSHPPLLPASLEGVSFDPNPCLSCGACCAHFRVSFYCGEIAGDDGGLVPPELVTQIGPLRACMRGTEQGGGRCVSLRGELGQPGISCDIYPLRPTPCREFEVWAPDGEVNPDCQRLRLALGLAALAPRPDAGNDPVGPADDGPDERGPNNPLHPGHPRAA
ncbi:zinc/iron-chelating domain-containing protein [Bordetella genomosp. 1]|uniref:Zinc/iron-chelating domain-containing protein n=1 Tax=Bordetella genomosp. 1 TaxID=1395607 RepID=A0A261SV94_9BORD|nr:YkgJ family cysteine cluster protein [Bordetella genomosp. 1]OZI40947.1 zinc/iron-chelating domain-containing protein [Bordetella genomosp. 1]